MKKLIRLEELAMFLFASFLFLNTNFDWWWFPVLILIPDVSMIGYAVNNKFGAYLYNFFHHKGLALFLYGIGFFFESPGVELAGIILFAHSSMDRLFGYGLKFNNSFYNSHLGKIGKNG